MKSFKIFLPVFLLLISISVVQAQQPVPGYNLRAAGAEYKRSSLYQSLFGHNYRKEWITPVNFKVLMLDTAFGGLVPEKEGGGHQSKSLHLKSKDGRSYALRSVNKTLDVLLPKIFYNTFVQHIVNDEISTSHPYAALAIPKLAEAANIYHTYPIYVYLPQQPALDTFNKKYGNNLYLLEQRPDGDWSNADNLGNFDKFISSEKVRDKLYEDNSRAVDQLAFVKARLFDMFIGDWDRHEDQWKWGTVEKDKKTFYVPVPEDRDQPFSKFDGLILKNAIGAAGAKYFQSFANDIPYPEGFSYERRNIDRYFTNRVTLVEWQNTAKELQKLLTDKSIEQAIQEMPREIFAISGKKIISNLKSRRGHLVEYATKYYLFIARDVDIVGSKNREYFDVDKINDNETDVNIYDLKDGEKRDQPFYSRKFFSHETKEIRLYGLSGKDIYVVHGDASNGIKTRLIGGDKKDSMDISGGGHKVQVYDDHDNNIFVLHSKAKLHLSSDSTVHNFNYDAFRPEKRGLKPTAGYSDEDRFYVGLAYGWQHHSFRKEPFAFRQSLGINYSISQNAISTIYTGIFPKAVGNWNLLLNGTYDFIRWQNFYGLGNETILFNDTKNYFRLRTEEWEGSIGLNHAGSAGNITVSGFYSGVKIKQDANRFINNDYLPVHPENNNTNTFAGGWLSYNFKHVNDSIIPVRGISFTGKAGYIKNLADDSKSFADFKGNLQFFIPILPKISLSITGGGETVTGAPEFYQYPEIGGGRDLRGYALERFHGKTTFYNSNELRFITNIRTHLLNGKGGIVAFYDDGRVWIPGENSNTWHTGYGGGILIAPFNVMFFDITYGISNESKLFQLRITTKL